MEKNAANAAVHEPFSGKNSQTLRLRKIVKDADASLIFGIVMLILCFASVAGFAVESRRQLDCTMYLNQYRLGSKTLTSAVRAYAATGDKQYYDAYVQELKVDKNRDTALERLKNNELTDSEWEALDRISELSDGLVPLEESTMEVAAAGDLDAAVSFVFGEEYKDTAALISSLTDSLIMQIQDRLKSRKNLMLMELLICALLFLLSFVRMSRSFVKTAKFAQNDLLMPILKVSEQMKLLAAGNLHAELYLEADDSEVGRMVNDIAAMKESLAGIIEELTFVLEQMGQGNYQVTIAREYVGEYVQIEESLRKIIGEMKNAIGEIAIAAREIDEGSGQLAAAAEDLADSCTSQACQVSDMAMRIEKLHESIGCNEKQSEEAVKISKLSSSTLVMTGEKMSELESSMKDMNVCLSRLKELDNAQQDTSQAAEELIGKAAAAVECGMRIVADVAVCMEEMQMGAEETSSRISGIVDSLKSEVESIDMINENADAIVGIVDYNSAISQETAAVGSQLKVQVNALVDLMERFRI